MMKPRKKWWTKERKQEMKREIWERDNPGKVRKGRSKTIDTEEPSPDRSPSPN
jgi:hypothetical protein